MASAYDRIRPRALAGARWGLRELWAGTGRAVAARFDGGQHQGPVCLVAVQQMIAAGNRIYHFPYRYGGAHGDPAQTMNQSNPNPAAVPGAEENGGPGYDCSSATSYVLWGGGLGPSLLGGGVLASGELESVGDPGPGKWVTIFATAGHAYIEVAGLYFDTARASATRRTRRRRGRGGAPSGPDPAGLSSGTRLGSDPLARRSVGRRSDGARRRTFHGNDRQPDDRRRRKGAAAAVQGALLDYASSSHGEVVAVPHQ